MALQEPQERKAQREPQAQREQTVQMEQTAQMEQTEQRGPALPVPQLGARMVTSTLSLTMRKFTKGQLGHGQKSQI